MNKDESGIYILYINNLCTGNEAKVMYSILAAGANTKNNTDYIVKVSGLSKNHFYTIRKQLHDKGLLGHMNDVYYVDLNAVACTYQEEFKC